MTKALIGVCRRGRRLRDQLIVTEQPARRIVEMEATGADGITFQLHVDAEVFDHL